MDNKLEKATFGAGCFWGVELAFSQLHGVKEAVSGYQGGTKDNPTYKEVCSGYTGHAEVVQVTYDPAEISYEELLDLFWKKHNPTQLNRQGPDFGTQYRSVIFYHSPEQKAAAEKSRDELQKSGKWDRPIVTFIEPSTTFYPAEDYHQKYLEKQGRTSCGI